MKKDDLVACACRKGAMTPGCERHDPQQRYSDPRDALRGRRERLFSAFIERMKALGLIG